MGNIALKIRKHAVVLPLTYDLKLAIFKTNDKKFKEAFEQDDYNVALQALRQKHKLADQGPRLYWQSIETFTDILSIKELNPKLKLKWNWFKFVDYIRSLLCKRTVIEIDEERLIEITRTLIQVRALVAGSKEDINLWESFRIFKFSPNEGEINILVKERMDEIADLLIIMAHEFPQLTKVITQPNSPSPRTPNQARHNKTHLRLVKK